MENKEIMDKLLENSHSVDQSNNQASADSKSKEDVALSRIRVITAKYKVYLVLLLIFICLLLLEYIPNMQDRYNSRQSSFNQVNSQLVSLESQIRDAQKEEQFLNEILANEDTLKNCLNEEDGEDCSSLPDSWKNTSEDGVDYNYAIPLSYLQLHSLYNAKMPVDEKKVLKNLNEYLIKEDISWNSRTRVWEILRISIWDPSAVKAGDTHFFKVPVNVSIKFTSVNELIWFLYNVEKKLIDNGGDRILYKIQTVSYDIVSNDEPQITEIHMLAYYYHDERFQDIEEGVITEETTDDVVSSEDNQDSEDTQEANESEWSFFDKLFN